MGRFLGIITGVILMLVSIVFVFILYIWNLWISPEKPISIFMAFVNIPSLIFIIGGTLIVTLISFSLKEILESFRAFFLVFTRKEPDFVNMIKDISETSVNFIRGGIPAIMKKINEMEPCFYKDILTMYVDGYNREEIISTSEKMIEARYKREMVNAYVLKFFAKTSFAFGIIGTILVMMCVFAKMADKFRLVESSSTTTTAGLGLQFTIFFFMVVGLATTFYGLIFAHLIFNPMAEKIMTSAENTRRYLYMIFQGVLLIIDKRPSQYIKNVLMCYIPPKYRRQIYSEAMK